MAQVAIASACPTHTFTEFTGIEYLQIDIASNFGLDKENWAERILWTESREDFLETLVADAEEPALFYAAVQAYRKAQAGKPSGYPISLDATSSGLQLLACLTGCASSARLCNVVPTGDREDAYTNIYQHMCDATGDSAKLTRDDCKSAIMTSLYGSTAQPKRYFGEGALLETFYKTMETYAPGAWSLNQALLQLWQPGALSHDWVLPDNFHVHVKVMVNETDYVQFMNRPVPVHIKTNQGTQDGLSLPANITHSVDGMVVREMHRRCDFDEEHVLHLLSCLKNGVGGESTIRDKDQLVLKLWTRYYESNFLSVRILDSLDAHNLGLVDPQIIWELIKTMPEKSFKVISIHDCFRVLPNYGNDLRRQYNQILSDIAGSKMLESIVSQIQGVHVPVGKAGNISVDILNADYALS